MFQSYSFRRDSIKKNSTIFSELLSDFPYFQLDELREEEFSSIIEMKTTKVADKIVKIMNNLWAYYSTSSNDVTSGSIDIVKRLEKEIKVKHKKAETIFYTGKDLDLNLISAPRIFIQSKKMSIVYKSTILFNIYDSPKFEDVMCILFSFSIYNICSDIKHISFILISVQRMQVRKNSSNPQDYRLFEKIDFIYIFF